MIFMFNKSLIFEVHGQRISCKSPWNLLRDWETSRHLHFLPVRSLDAHCIQLYGMSIMKNFHRIGFMDDSWKPKVMLKTKADTEKCQVFCWGGAIFLPHRSGSALWFHLRSSGTGDRLIPFRHLPGRKCDVLFRSTSCDRNTDKRFLMGPWGDRDTCYQSEMNREPTQFNHLHTHALSKMQLYTLLCISSTVLFAVYSILVVHRQEMCCIDRYLITLLQWKSIIWAVYDRCDMCSSVTSNSNLADLILYITFVHLAVS